MEMLWAVLVVAGAASPAPGAEPIVRAFERGQVVRAVHAARKLRASFSPRSDTAARLRLVELFGLLRQKKGRESRELLALIDTHGPDLGTYGTYLNVSSLSALGDCAAAHRRFAILPTESIFRTTSLARVASCWIRAGDGNRAHAAVDAMEESAESESRLAEAAHLRARVVESGTNRHDAQDLYRRVVVRYPLTSAGRRAADWLQRAGSSGLRIAPMAPEELLPRAEHERASFRLHKARETYDAIVKRSRGRRHANLRHQAELGLVELDMVDRRYHRALQRLAHIERSSRDTELLAHALFLRGDIQSRRGRVSASLASFEKVLTEYPDAAYAPEAALAAARLAYGARRFHHARWFLAWMRTAAPVQPEVEIIAGDGARKRGQAAAGLHDHAQWLSAWIERRTGGPSEVMDSYLAAIDAHCPLAEAALYWRARLAIDEDRRLDAEVFAAMLTQRAPASYYALAARDLLTRRAPGGAAVVELPRAVGFGARPAVEPLDLWAATVLSQAGLHSEARRLVRMVPTHQLSHADRAAAAWLYRKSGNVHRATVLTRHIASDAQLAGDPVVLELAYPRAFATEVNDAASKLGVPAALVFAVMRQESAFKPDAISPRKARGLMQMIGPTAVRMAESARLRRFRQKHLFTPKVSIRLGTLYLSQLLAQFDANLVAAVASYHAGEHRVAQWLKTRGHLEPDELLEEIPFATTRGYTRKVLASYGVYRMLYEGAERPLGIGPTQLALAR